MASRLRTFVGDLTRGLRRAGFEVETFQSYLLNSTHHPIEVPCSVQGIPLEASFEVAFPKWSNEPVGRFRYSVNHGRRFYKTESKIKRVIPLRLVVRRIVREVYLELERRRVEAEGKENLRQALDSLQKLGAELGVAPENGELRAGKWGLVVAALPETPTRVSLTITVPHDQALEIIRKYGKRYG